MLLKASSGVLVVVPILHLSNKALLRKMSIPFIACFPLMGVLSVLGRASLVCRVEVAFPLTKTALGRVVQLSGMSLLVSFPMVNVSGCLGRAGSGVVVQPVKLQLSRAAVERNWLVSEGDFSIMVTRARLLWAVSVST